MVNIWDNRGEGGGWSPSFTRSFSNQELEEVEKFFAYYSAFESKDKLILKESKAGSYSVKFMCEVC